MKSGLYPIKRDRRDYSLHKNFGATVFDAKTLPTDFSVDVGLWMPNQEITQAFTGLPTIPALPFGCTDYAQSDLAVDESGTLKNPLDIENITHANQNGGGDIREALKAAISLGWGGAYYNVQSSGLIDWFDAVRIAIWISQSEKRAISVGTPWFPEWENPTNGVLPVPASFDVSRATWHNWTIVGWTTINGVLYLKGKSWQGPTYGDNGFHYISRELFNAVMNINGTAAFTLSSTKPDNPLTIDWSVVSTLVEFIKSLLSKWNQPTGDIPTQKQIALYNTAKAALGTVVAPLNATDSYGVYGCAITLNLLCERAWGTQIGGGYSTAAMLPFLQDRTKFQPIQRGSEMAGDIIISSTGTSRLGPTVSGHVGVLGNYGILSNNSENGHLEENYTIESWYEYFNIHKLFPVSIFRPL